MGNTPLTGVIFDNEGNLYGTTSSGGSGSGVLFELSAVALPGWLKAGSAGVWNGSTLTVNTPPGTGSTASVNQVNSADLQILLAGLNKPGSWDQGDFNYDGQVNSADLQLLLFTLNTSLPS